MDGGFLLKFDGKFVDRCLSVNLDYDNGTYSTSNVPNTNFTKGLKEITILLERE